MYERHYGLRKKPFSLLPDPSFLYLGERHGMAMRMLEYGLLSQAGFLVITGEIGAGKTTLIRHLLAQAEPDTAIGLVSNTHPGFSSILPWLLQSFGLRAGDDPVAMHDAFLQFAVGRYAKAERLIIIVDEAQNLRMEALEELRTLSNMNADQDQLMQIILVGQTGLRDSLRRPDMVQLAQRVVVDYHLAALSRAEAGEYIDHRLKRAGAMREIFDARAKDRIYHYSGGIPRLVNMICDTALVHGYAENRAAIGLDIVDDVARDREKGGITPFRSMDGSGNDDDRADGEWGGPSRRLHDGK